MFGVNDIIFNWKTQRHLYVTGIVTDLAGEAYSGYTVYEAQWSELYRMWLNVGTPAVVSQTEAERECTRVGNYLEAPRG